jgi:hypothetical protein
MSDSATYTVIARSVKETPMAIDSAAVATTCDWKVIVGVERHRGVLCLFRIDDHHCDGDLALWMSQALLHLLGMRSGTELRQMHVHENEKPAGISLYQVDSDRFAKLAEAQRTDVGMLSANAIWARRRNSAILQCITEIMSTALTPAAE